MDKELSKGVNYVIWGLLFLNVNFKIYNLEILGPWTGCIFLLCAVDILKKYNLDIELTTNILYILIGYEILKIVIAMVMPDILNSVYFIMAIKQVFTCYLQFSFATVVHDIFRQRGCESRKLLLYRNISIVTITIFTVTLSAFEATNTVIIISAIMHLTAVFAVITEIYKLNKRNKTIENQQRNSLRD